jgi:hypothetical protein
MKNKDWWYDEHLMGLYGAMFECGDYEGLLDKIRKIVAEAERRGREAAWEQVADVWGTKVLEDAIYLIRANRR